MFTHTRSLHDLRCAIWCVVTALVLVWWVGIFGRGYWTPDEPREADIAWRMSWQSGKAVPSLAGEAFCEKPPLTYWIAGASIDALGPAAWAARLPNLLYAAIAALAMAVIGQRSLNAVAGAAAAAALATFLLSYQVAIWLATDAPLLACVAAALCGAYIGFYPASLGDRWRGYTFMHAALAAGFMSKSAAAWMVPALAILALVVWERRWRELLRPELYAGLLIQAAVIGGWIWFVRQAPEGDADLRVFFWNNLVGRFAHVDAPQDLQYAAGHRNFPGKYLIELPLYLWPWTLLVIAALRRAWLDRRQPWVALRPVRFALAAFLPTLAMLSVAATARNVYLAPALPGLALLLGWWVNRLAQGADPWDLLALRITAVLLLLATAVVGAAAVVIGRNASLADFSNTATMSLDWGHATLAACGILGSAVLAVRALSNLKGARIQRSLLLLLASYCVLLSSPAWEIYRHVDKWQDLGSIGRAIARDSADRPLILLGPDETTRAFIDMYARKAPQTIASPIDAAAMAKLRDLLAASPRTLIAVQVPGHRDNRASPSWSAPAGLRTLHSYVLPNGRSYALLERD